MNLEERQGVCAHQRQALGVASLGPFLPLLSEERSHCFDEVVSDRDGVASHPMIIFAITIPSTRMVASANRGRAVDSFPNRRQVRG
jgi:hypothetical protein